MGWPQCSRGNQSGPSDIADVLDRAAVERAVVLGCSVGGLAAMSFALNQPERCEALILTGAAATFGPPERWPRSAEAVRKGGIEAIAPAAVERWLAPGTVDRCQHVVTQLMADFVRLEPATFYPYASMIERTDLTRRLGEIAAATLIIVGENDVSSPVADARVLEKGIVGASVAIVDGARHLANLDAPEVFNALVAGFLAGSIKQVRGPAEPPG